MLNAPLSPALRHGAPDLALWPVRGFDAAGLPVLDAGRVGLALAPQPITAGALIAVCRAMDDGTLAVLGYAPAPMPAPAPPVDAARAAPDPDAPLVLEHGRARIALYPDGRIRIEGDDVLVESSGRAALSGAWIDLN